MTVISHLSTGSADGKSTRPEDSDALFWFRLTGLDHVYVDAFKLAADALADFHDNESSSRRDELLIVIGFLYRHYFEVQMKHLLRLGNELGEFSVPEKWLNREHALEPLWNKVRQLLDRECSDNEAPTFEAIDALIQEFHSADPTGQEFRYHMTTSDRESLKDLPLGWLIGLKDRMQEVHAAFSDYASLLSVQIDERNGHFDE
jgi:hypothetical protein